MLFEWQRFEVNAIALSLVLIFYLLIIELGNEKIKRMFGPIVVALMVAFISVVIREVLT